uniref:Uncharacterized protein n=1 Tax=Solanum lycopersicum TaxID=4081 RepID=A0A3Q7G755_SOLLC
MEEKSPLVSPPIKNLAIVNMVVKLRCGVDTVNDMLWKNINRILFGTRDPPVKREELWWSPSDTKSYGQKEFKKWGPDPTRGTFISTDYLRKNGMISYGLIENDSDLNHCLLEVEGALVGSSLLLRHKPRSPLDMIQKDSWHILDQRLLYYKYEFEYGNGEGEGFRGKRIIYDEEDEQYKIRDGCQVPVEEIPKGFHTSKTDPSTSPYKCWFIKNMQEKHLELLIIPFCSNTLSNSYHYLLNLFVSNEKLLDQSEMPFSCIFRL